MKKNKIFIVVAVMLILNIVLLSLLFNKNKLDASDLAKSQGIFWWNIEVRDINKDQLLSLQTVSVDEVKSHGGIKMRGQSPISGKLFVFDVNKKVLRYSFVTKTMSMSGVVDPNPFKDFSGWNQTAPTGSNIKLGDILLKGSVSGGTSSDNKIILDEIGIAFGVK